jgi:deazaflavin-dependent oxidoreductase (nitroreductase family)
MAYLKPPALTRRVANPLAMRLGGRGVATLTVTGRRTGEPRKVPVIPVDIGESDWVRNLRAAGRGALSRRGHAEIFDATEVPPEQREAIITRYRELAGHSVDKCFTRLPAPTDHPVFQVGQAH